MLNLQVERSHGQIYNKTSIYVTEYDLFLAFLYRHKYVIWTAEYTILRFCYFIELMAGRFVRISVQSDFNTL